MDPIITLASVPAVIALVNLIKSTGFLPPKFAAVLAVLLGIALVAGNTYLPGIWDVLSEGIILGLSAAGIYDVSVAQPKRAITE
jgi:hypothetical protein